MIFKTLTPAPPDAILGLVEAFKKDENPRKVNLGVGVFMDENGVTPVLKSVKLAEHAVLEKEKSKNYLPISGMPEYGACVEDLLFGDPSVRFKRHIRVAQTPGGTGALRVGAELLKKYVPESSVWVSSPTWANHKAIFGAAGLAVEEYAYYDSETRGLDFAGMKKALNNVPEKDIVLMHVCCHNPTGVDLDEQQWRELAELARLRKWIPFFDFAYQGFGKSLEDDRKPLIPFLEEGVEFLVASSFSKNFGLYNERVGALTLVSSDAASSDIAFSHVKTTIRAMYSNPPVHGASAVVAVLGNRDLRTLWEKEVAAMRDRIAGVRSALVANLAKRGAKIDFSFINKQRGMFSFSGLNDAQVKFLREQKSIYMVGGGRMNVAGILEKDMDYLCDSIIEALG